jgi:hypothetical protein
MLQFLPYAMAAYGGYRGYKDSKDQGISGINRLLNTATGATIGYYGGKTALSAGSSLGVPGFSAAQSSFTPFTALPGIRGIPMIGQGVPQPTPALTGDAKVAEQIAAADRAKKAKALADANKAKDGGGSLLDIFRKKDSDEYDPLKISLAAAGIPLAMGAFDQGPTDIYQPTYNVAYADFAAQRPGYTYIDPQTGQEKQYEKVYIPEADPKNQGDFRMGPYAMERTRLRTGGLAEIRRFNEGGINYLPSKLEHDENDANNYVRAHGYIEDGSGAGDKDEDTMLAQLADGEFVTRADGVLGAGIIAGANPNSMKDMREKGAQYFYEQQKRYKRVFDLLKDKYGDSTKTN